MFSHLLERILNYKHIYNQIIEHARNRATISGYSEIHHIVPRSLNGSDDHDNLVRLTAREHFICHYLLTKMYAAGTNEWHRMNHAFLMMKSDNDKRDRYFNSRLYEACRKNFSTVMSQAQSGDKNSQHGSIWITDGTKSKKHRQNEPIPNGWHKGRRLANIKGRVCITNGQQKRYIDATESLPTGWYYGSHIRRGPAGQRITNGIEYQYINLEDSIPFGWWLDDPRRCNRCGQNECVRPEICQNTQRIKRFISHLDFDQTVIGTKDFYIEYDKIVDMLKNDYIIRKLTIIQMAEKYGFKYEQAMRALLQNLDIYRPIRERPINK